MQYRDLLSRWRQNVDDPALKEELDKLVAAPDEEVEDAFYQELSFGTAGLRGVLGAGTNRMNVHTVGKATQGIADYLTSHPELPASVAVCYDSRINSQRFAHVACAVLAANGVHSFVYPRLEPTPALSFAVRHLGCGIGINVTASHNPSEYNGYKVYGPDGCQITDSIAEGITKAIETIDVFDDVRTMDFDDAVAQGLVEFISEETLDAYLDAVFAQDLDPRDLPGFDGDAGLSVVYTPLNGTGLECVSRILERIDVRDVHVVEQQAMPDGHFPTCPYPNPENRAALELGIELCRQVKHDLLLATDPDADRVGIAVLHEGEPRLLSGNEVGVLLLDYVCRMRTALDSMPKDPVTVTTVVSSSMVDAVAQRYGVTVRRVLTGFKYIGGQIAQLESEGAPERFVFGFEESYGYLAGTHARDKDAVVTSMLICQMARYYRAQGKNLYQAMQDLYAEFGFYRNETLSYSFEGVAGAHRMQELMRRVRTQPFTSIGGLNVTDVRDYECGLDGLPSANVVEFDLAGGCKAIVRPSGTEPKIKVYLFAYGKTKEQADRIRQEMAQDLNGLFA